MILNDFYAYKKVLITGHTGFKGSWLTLFLHQLGARVTGIALAPKTEDDFYVVNGLDKLCDSNIFDISDFQSVQKIVTATQPDLVFHLAAQPLVRYSYNHPLETFQTNVMGTANILEAVKNIKSRCAVVVITTDKVYENPESHQPFREPDRLGGNDPYSASKASSELAVSSFRHAFFNPAKVEIHQKGIATARAGNVIGGGDWSDDRLIPDLVKAIRNDREIIIRNPEAVRPWQHVLEPLYGYLMLGAKLYDDPVNFGGAWNFGPFPGEILRVEDVVKTAISILNKGSYTIKQDPEAVHEATLLRLDISKALNHLSWEPRLTTQEAISLTLNWYDKLLTDRTAVYDYSVQSIEEYLKLAGT
jgi:CDP-glucose 4,6-dehydratase